ncbi:MAG: hypothetical protein R6V48_05245, partial [Fidelibacterota bacterium]
KAGTAMLLWGAIAASLIYTFGKLWEYADLYSNGYNLGTNMKIFFRLRSPGRQPPFLQSTPGSR